LEKVVKNVAITLKCTVIGANLVGTVTNGLWAGQIYGGQSVAVDYLGKSIALGKNREAEVLIFVLAK
jgi:predicted amidohydrolase